MVYIRFGHVFRVCKGYSPNLYGDRGWGESYELTLSCKLELFGLNVFILSPFFLMETCNLFSCLIIVIRCWAPSALLACFSSLLQHYFRRCYNLV